jgi:hypothetical protein
VEEQGTWAHQQRKRDERQRDKPQNQRKAASAKRSREGRVEKLEEGESCILNFEDEDVLYSL